MNHLLQFSEYMASFNIAVEGCIFDDGELHRFHVKGDTEGTKNGWYVLHHSEITVGIFGSWKTGLKEVWTDRKLSSLNKVDRAKYQRKINQAKKSKQAAIDALHEKTALQADDILQSSLPADPKHPYLLRKNIKPYGLPQSDSYLLVPLRDHMGKVWSIQRISEDGSKRFLTGGKIKGCFYLFGELSAGVVFVCEGLATGATIHQETARPVVCAMTAGNLINVCRDLSDPSYQVILCADNDHGNEINIGLTKAREAAAEIGAGITWPESCGQSCKCTDFNDIANCPRDKEVSQ